MRTLACLSLIVSYFLSLSLAFAQEPSTLTLTPTSTTPPLIVSPSGYYYLQSSAEGVPEINPVPVVINLGEPDNPNPDPEDPNDPNPPQKLEDRVAAWAKAADDPTALKPLSTLYKQVASLIDSGSLSPDQAKLAISFGVDALLQQLGTTEQWVTFRSNLDSALASSSEPLDVLYNKVAVGLEAAQ